MIHKKYAQNSDTREFIPCELTFMHVTRHSHCTHNRHVCVTGEPSPLHPCFTTRIDLGLSWSTPFLLQSPSEVRRLNQALSDTPLRPIGDFLMRLM